MRNVTDLKLIKKVKNFIPSASREKGYLYEYPLKKEYIRKLICKVWLQV